MKILSRPQTIQVFLPSGDARGIRIAEVTTRIVQAIEIPRSALSDFFSMPESQQIAVYFLFGHSEEGESLVYIGQTSDLKTRLGLHHKEKDFWQRAVVIVSRTKSLTNTHALYVEWKALEETEKAGRYQKTNVNKGCRPYTPAPLEADCLEILDTMRIILGTLSYPIFEPLLSQKQKHSDTERFYCMRAGISAVGEYTEEGFVIMKGSTGRADASPNFQSRAYTRLKEQLLAKGKISIDGENLLFNEDVLFNSPSGAATLVIGSAANGWVEWKRKDGQTLDAVKRSS
ncbi:MAG: GIY-YIG nuclease family protein [Paenalcaligenes sp.]